MNLLALTARARAICLWVGMTGLSIAAYFGYRCPAPGCPCCKMVGK